MTATSPGRKALNVALTAIALTVCVVVAGLFTYYPLKGVFNRAFRTPAIVKQPFVQELQEPDGLRQRQQLLEAWSAGATSGLHRQVSTAEGKPVQLWLVTDRATLTLITDFTRDTFSRRDITVGHPTGMNLCKGSDDSDPLRAWFPRSDQVYLRLRFEDGSNALF